ncbi:DUF6053 domain-containing protein [Lysobacter enzymogenes]|uniref:DUF6053 domain-containing protein n=1 Tax=Lysobacter enzymogenes TaxID=69 RepID=UPI003D18A308
MAGPSGPTLAGPPAATWARSAVPEGPPATPRPAAAAASEPARGILRPPRAAAPLN